MSMQKLAFFMHLVLNNPKLLQPVELIDSEDNEVVEEPVLLSQIKRFNVPPFWQETCPPEFDAKWGKHWSDIYEEIQDLKDSKRVSLENFDWKDRGLGDVIEADKEEAWSSCMDAPVRDYLVGIEFSVYDRFSAWAKLQATRNEEGEIIKGFVGVNSWSGRVDSILEGIFGKAVYDRDITPSDSAKTWFSGTMNCYLGAARKQYQRACRSINKTQAALENALGERFWEHRNLPKHFQLSDARNLLAKLKNWKAQLMWQVLSDEDQKLREREIDVTAPDAPDQIAARFDSLGVEGKKWDFCQMALGYIAGVITARTGKPVELELDDEYDAQIFSYGQALAATIPRNRIELLSAPTEREFQAFRLELTDFAISWEGKDGGTLSTAISMYENPDFDAGWEMYIKDGIDIGVAKFKESTPAQLVAFLGWDHTTSLPVPFRAFTADEPAMLPKVYHEGPFMNSNPVS
ncbi:hypothetical protein F5880DRAFT_1511719, partial [Lentinula raphanica]